MGGADRRGSRKSEARGARGRAAMALREHPVRSEARSGLERVEEEMKDS